jgi:hypothetical protein
MIRIDENIYIDDTPVTCAEYQLFIDEMREQGKYFQPDHWISFQFPSGLARAPIVGVRFSDAIAFCKWLTKRETGEWSLRLPTSSEAGQYPLANPAQSPLGYWTIGPDNDVQFAWVGDKPVNPRNLTSGFARERAYENAIDSALASARDRALNLDEVYYNILNIVNDRALARDINLARQRSIRFTFEGVLDFTRFMDINLYFDIYTLQERIAGRSPAFEGIRLAKERKP